MKDTDSPAHEELKSLKKEVARLTRELRNTQNLLSVTCRSMESKEAFGRVMAAETVTQRAYTGLLLEHCPNIILLLDKEKRFLLSTRAFLTTTETPNFAFIKNRPYWEVLANYLDVDTLRRLDTSMSTVASSEDREQFDCQIDFSSTGGSRHYSVEVIRIKAGQDAEQSVTGSFLVVFTDMTDVMREKMRAEAANRTKSDFLAAMSHEIRTPMNAIMGMGEMLSRTSLNEKQGRYITDIKSASKALLAIINDILDFSKIEAGRMELVNTGYNLHGMLNNLHSIFGHLFKTKDLEFNCNIDDSLPSFITGDENRLRQVLMNLLSNALKYTPKGKVVLEARCPDGEKLVFSVQDTGIGIREEDKQKLFKPFEQFDLLRNRNQGGTGLGLAICRNLCTMMGGNLDLQSVYGKGSTFQVTIPCVLACKLIHEETASMEDFKAPEASVLVVDDLEINLAVVEAMLSLYDIVPDWAFSGYEAIQRASGKKYDIIFMDHMMPEMDGIETTKILRESEGLNSRSSIVALTANAMNGMEELFLQSGFDDFLPKPLEVEALSRCLRRHLPHQLVRTERGTSQV